MKKIISLILVFVMCLSLCACGGMPGEEAALLYPDIIGKWGTDPFGEEYALALSEDGSCSILGHEGTWTLNEKNSSGDYFELSVKTEAMKYTVVLDIWEESFWFEKGLFITDAKKETSIYGGQVFRYDNQYLSHEMALQVVPELVGEWGSLYWNEESVLTINEDGTCTLLRQPGKWCLNTNHSTWPDLEMVIKLENGIQHYVKFQMDADMKWGYPEAHIFLYNDIYQNAWEKDFRVINRNQVIHPMDFASIAVGEWAEGENKQPFATFREDGTCAIRGAEGLWSLDYTAYYNEKFRNGWDYCLRAKIKDEEYDIRFTNPDDYGLCSMYILNEHDNMMIVDASYAFKVNAG